MPGPLPPTYPLPQELLLGVVPQGSCSHTLAPPAGPHTHAYPTDLFPSRCTLELFLIFGLGKEGGMGRDG